MAMFDDLFNLVFPFRTSVSSDTNTLPTEPLPLIRRSPGEHVPPGLSLISACHDASLVERVLGGFRRGLDKQRKRDLSLPWGVRRYIEKVVSERARLVGNEDIGLARFYEFVIAAIEPMIHALGHKSIKLMESSMGIKLPPHDVPGLQYFFRRQVFPGGLNAAPESGSNTLTMGGDSYELFNPVLIHGYMVCDLKAHYHGFSRIQGVDQPGLGADLLDIRLVTATGEQIALQTCFSDKSRFAIFWALPYIIITELIDAKHHLLISDLCSSELEPEDSTATPTSLLAVLLGVFMNYFDDYGVDAHSPKVEERIRYYVKELEQSSTAKSDHPSDVRPENSRDPTLDTTSVRSSTSPGDNATAPSTISQAEQIPKPSEATDVLVKQNDSGVMARHCPEADRSSVMQEIYPTRMVAVLIELVVDDPSDESSSASSSSQAPAKKIRLDADAPRPKLTEVLPRAIGRLFSLDAQFTRAQESFFPPIASTSTTRLDLIRRVGRGAGSIVSPVAKASPSTPIKAYETTSVTSPASFGDPTSTLFTPPASELQSATRSSPVAGVEQGKFIAKYFPAFYGLYRSGTERHAYVFVMEHASSPIAHERLESNTELKAKVDAAFRLVADEGLVHDDEGARNVLLRPDGRICLIDWGEARRS
ncbi:BQ2448_1947 [Microbotryum intermedium]|uniref:BQ2448_1947 protein n=1 Tax=Microbotryum intermedium TaxID=269621 RepID=A0A238F700_9BASI|nr:BQ2448_1947 [Microbotryum intermedium]